MEDNTELFVKEYIKKYVEQEIKKERELEHPVGSFYISEVDTNPKEVFGFGTWEQIEGKFLLGADSEHIVKSTGGNLKNKHQHYQTVSFDSNLVYMSTTPTRTRVVSNKNGAVLAPTQIGNFQKREDSTYEEEIDITPPFYAVNIWRRRS